MPGRDYSFFTAFGMKGAKDEIFDIDVEAASVIRFVAGGTHNFVALTQNGHDEVCQSLGPHRNDS